MMHRTEPTGLQKLALQLAEKLGSLVENNERVFDSKQGSFGYFGRGELVVFHFTSMKRHSVAMSMNVIKHRSLEDPRETS